MKTFQLIIFLIIFFVMGSIVGIFLFQGQNSLLKNDSRVINTDINQNFSLKINQSAKIKSENITIKFLNVTEDSRCPQGGTCLWPGQVKVLLKFSKNGKIRKFTLISPPSIKKLNQKRLGGYKIKLRSVKPYPQAGKTTELRDYEINLVLIK